MLDRENWEAKGYMELPHFFDSSYVDAMSQQIDRAWQSPGNLVVDIIPTGRRQLIGATDRAVRKFPYKISDLYLESPTLRRAIAQLAPALADILGDRPCIVNSLHFERGSEQASHVDVSYMPGKSRGGMCAAWIALEDVLSDAGPLEYFPGSHKLEPPIDFWQSPVQERLDLQTENHRQLENACTAAPVQALLRAGDVFIWHEMLLHAGAKIRNMALTRRSIVVHFWRQSEVPGQCIPIDGNMSWWSRPHPPTSDTTPAYKAR